MRRSELSTVEISHPETAFYMGQVVRCRVLSCYPDQGKLYLSLIVSHCTALIISHCTAWALQKERGEGERRENGERDGGGQNVYCVFVQVLVMVLTDRQRHTLVDGQTD